MSSGAGEQARVTAGVALGMRDMDQKQLRLMKIRTSEAGRDVQRTHFTCNTRWTKIMGELWGHAYCGGAGGKTALRREQRLSSGFPDSLSDFDASLYRMTACCTMLAKNIRTRPRSAFLDAPSML